AEQVRFDALPSDIDARLSNQSNSTIKPLLGADGAAERIADVPLYFSDSIVRRSPPLQATHDARPPKARANACTLRSFGLDRGDVARVKQGEASALLEVMLDDTLADGVVQVSAAHETTATLGPMFGPVTLERA
ncbi:MAG: NADH-quinone oxidoreductase subunit G, partial [Burkholderiaceae bacterium]